MFVRMSVFTVETVACRERQLLKQHPELLHAAMDIYRRQENSFEFECRFRVVLSNICF